MGLRDSTRQRFPPIPRALCVAVGFLCAATAGSLIGCGGSMASVSGTVTLDGKPIEGSSNLYATVNFYRADGSGAPATGMIRESGQYEIVTGGATGLEPGKYKVAVTLREIIPPAAPGGLTGNKRIGPAKYAQPAQSGFSADVQPGNNTFDFALVSEGET